MVLHYWGSCTVLYIVQGNHGTLVHGLCGCMYTYGTACVTCRNFQQFFLCHCFVILLLKNAFLIISSAKKKDFIIVFCKPQEDVVSSYLKLVWKTVQFHPDLTLPLINFKVTVLSKDEFSTNLLKTIFEIFTKLPFFFVFTKI